MKPVDQKNLEQGTDFMMVVKVTNNTFKSDRKYCSYPDGSFRMGDIRTPDCMKSNYGLKEK